MLVWKTNSIVHTMHQLSHRQSKLSPCSSLVVRWPDATTYSKDGYRYAINFFDSHLKVRLVYFVKTHHLYEFKQALVKTALQPFGDNMALYWMCVLHMPTIGTMKQNTWFITVLSTVAQDSALFWMHRSRVSAFQIPVNIGPLHGSTRSNASMSCPTWP